MFHTLFLSIGFCELRFDNVLPGGMDIKLRFLDSNFHLVSAVTDSVQSLTCLATPLVQGLYTI